jgi:hypothetical protein
MGATCRRSVYSGETLSEFMKRAGFDIVHRTRTLRDLRIVARPSARVCAGVGASAAAPLRTGAYWEARAFHEMTPLLLYAVDVAKRVRRLVRHGRQG